MEIDLDDLMACEKCGCVFDKAIATYHKKKTEWYGTTCKAKCPCCKATMMFNLGDGYYK